MLRCAMTEPQPQYQQPFAPPAFQQVSVLVTDQTNKSTQAVIAWVLTIFTAGYLLPWAIAASRTPAPSAGSTCCWGGP